MKLQTYFNQQKAQGLSDIQKMDVYYSIMDKNMKKSFQRKRSFLHVKSFVYTSFLLFFFVGFYGMYLFQNQIPEDNEGYMLSRLGNTNVAQADFVAKIVDFDGSFYIEQSGKKIQTSNIKDGDVVILDQSAEIVFHIDNDTKAKIVGPAKFVINKKGDNSYKIALINGQYVEMLSLKKQNNHMIELAVDGILVSQGESKKPLNFQLMKQGEGHVIKNNGAKLVVTAEDKKTTRVEKQQVLSMQGNDISLFDNFDKFAKAVKDKNLSQTFSLIAKLENTGSNQDGDNVDVNIKELDGDEILNINDDNTPDIDLGLSSDQKVATPEQTKVIELQLDKFLLQINLNELVTAYKEGNSIGFANAYSDLEKKISNVSKAFQYDYNTAVGSEQEKIISIIGTIEKLSNNISSDYLIPPKYIDSLKSIIPYLSPLKSITFPKISMSDSGKSL